MPWKECKPMDERLKFVARLLDGQKNRWLIHLLRQRKRRIRCGATNFARFENTSWIGKR